MSEILTPKEAAEFLKVSEHTLKQSLVPFFYIHPGSKRVKRYLKADLLAWIELQTHPELKPPRPAKRAYVRPAGPVSFLARQSAREEEKRRRAEERAKRRPGSFLALLAEHEEEKKQRAEERAKERAAKRMQNAGRCKKT